ncbi:hypothetical protein TSUD_225790 [Trifolium subterraneum]|uniref:NPH3 domain-containing protein n=1 Tax=Trifolium subterraneum TaxID=3900 RepID=A0A2Z6M2S3_TRISU|nr:hypothetical protein TSUD_225790 [Trifolium subterraneum]
MKFMKLGSKPDSFQTDGENVRYVATELASDIVVNVGDVKFYLHKFPLLSKSLRLQKLVSDTNEEDDEIHIHDIPGGPVAFEICAKFCYGMVVTLNAYNVVAARCAAEYLEMYESIEKGNLIYKIEVFLNSSIFRSWKDSIIVLQTTKSLLPWSEELKIVSHCIESIATKASMDPSKVEWSYTYNRKKLPSENGNDSHWNGVRKQLMVPKDWWVEDLCDLQLDLYKRVMSTIMSNGNVSGAVVGEALSAYASRRLPGFNKGVIQSGDFMKNRLVLETIVCLLPPDMGSGSCGFSLKLLKVAIQLECDESVRSELMRRIGQRLEEATVADLLICATAGETTYDVETVQKLLEVFVAHGQEQQSLLEDELQEIRSPKMEHPGISKSERKRICRLMDCRKLSAEACMHAVQNERLPLRVVVQVLFFEQMRASTTSSSGGTSTPDLPGSIRALHPGESHGSSRSTTTNTEEEWDAVATAEDIKVLKGELAALKLSGGSSQSSDRNSNNAEKVAANKMKGFLMSKKIFSKIWSNKEKNGEITSSDTSESPASTVVEETKSTPSRSRRQSVS